MITETGRRRVVPWRYHVHQRPHALGAPLESVELVSPEQIFYRGVPPGAVLRMIPAGDPRGFPVNIARGYLGEALDGWRATFQNTGIDLHAALARRFLHFLK